VIRAAILYHVYSGHLFFTAAAMFIAGVLVSRLRVLTLLAIPLAALSGTPMRWPAAAIVLIAVAAYIAFQKKTWARALAIGAALAAAGLELPHHLARPRVRIPERLFVIGDSLASGGFGESAAWPGRLAATNLARPSDTAATAHDQVALLPEPGKDDLVMIEIGGNDMMERVAAGTFGDGLEQILSDVRPRRIVILELPLLPGAWRYGAAQRRLARSHGAVLVPKRIVARVLADRRNTSDGLHLNDRGHALLARDLGRWLRWSQ
jgi:lysophospholipase L1-like esterase